MKGDKQPEDEEEFVLLDLDDIYVSADIPANAPYVLSGLNTTNPTLVIGDQLKLPGESSSSMDYKRAKLTGLTGKVHVGRLLTDKANQHYHIGEYQETIGTCCVFSESDGVSAVANSETGPSDKNLPDKKCTVDSNQAPTKKVKPVAYLHKILKFKVSTED